MSNGNILLPAAAAHPTTWIAFVKIMGQRTDLPQFDDLDYPKKDIIELYISSELDSVKNSSKVISHNKLQNLQVFFRRNSK